MKRPRLFPLTVCAALLLLSSCAALPPVSVHYNGYTADWSRTGGLRIAVPVQPDNSK